MRLDMVNVCFAAVRYPIAAGFAGGEAVAIFEHILAQYLFPAFAPLSIVSPGCAIAALAIITRLLFGPVLFTSATAC